MNKDEWDVEALELSRETRLSYVEALNLTNQLRALGWSSGHAQRGIMLMLKTGLSFAAMWQGSELAGADTDERRGMYLDALSGERS